VATDDDLVGDVTGVLDALKVARAHLVARAGGVHVAQLVAKRAPDRVASLILVATDRFNTQPTANPGGETSAPTFVLSGTEDGLVTAILRHTSGGWQHQADRLANRSVADNPTGWFNELYTAATAGEVDMPWDRDEPNPVLSGWAHEHPVTGDRRTALIVGSGLGRDAEFIASLGFDTTAFDVSPAAIANSHTRYPESPVDYRVANLLDPPTEWTRAFDLVVEIFTVQAMPRTVRTLATANIGQFVAPGGTLVVIQAYAVPVDEHGPPWILSRAEIDAFAADGLRAAHVDVVDSPSGRRWLAEFGRTA
jgi:pimeloyl-ACP methyl ester carboxylesterase